MAIQDYIEVDSIDLTKYRLNWQNEEEWDMSIGILNITFAPSVTNAITLTVGMEITVQRGFTTATDEYVFIGVITQVKPETSKIVCSCKNPLYDAIKSRQTKSWDKNIDTEGGVGSEIFKTICTHSGISYTSASVPTTGTADSQKITKFIQNDEDDFDRMNELANRYQRVITYDYDNDIVVFKEKGFTTYPVTLNVGTEIQGQIKWKENMEQMINKVTVNGATVYDKVIESFAGPASEFTLSKTPEDTQVFINHATTDDLQTRGQKDIGTLGTDFDYYVDVQQKKLVFNAAVSDLWINYGAQVPMPVIRKNQTSIDTYGGPNKKPHHRKFTYTDLKDISDAENRAYSILTKYSVPFNEVQNIPINDSVIIANGNFAPGTVVRIIDVYNNKDLNVFVKSVTKSWPHIGDTITVGDEIWRTEDWQADVSKKINQLFNELNKNQDIVITVEDLPRVIPYERRYMYLESRNVVGDVGVYGHPLYGIYGTSLYGTDVDSSFILDSSKFGIMGTSVLGTSSGSTFAIYKLVHKDNTYKEYFYDTDFDGTGTATWDTTNKWLSFTSGQTRTIDFISLGHTHTFFKITIGSQTGSILYEITGDGGDTWQTVTVNLRTAFSSASDAGVKIRMTENGTSTAKIQNTYTISGRYNLPGIKCVLEG